MNTKKDLVQSTIDTGITMPPIAIIGLAGIFPEAENLNQYWQNILKEVDCIREVPPSRWKIQDYYDPDPSVPDKTYSKHGGFIPDIQFDPMEFGLPPNLLEVTDVSQLLSLIVAKKALKDAGYLEASEDIRQETGVILGMVGMSSNIIHPLLNRLQYPVWERVLKSSSIPDTEIPEIIEKMKLAYIAWNENAFPGAIGNVVAGRVANRLDLGNTNCTVDAACGSSLAAISMAVSELALGKADMMITGGVDTDNSILTYLCFSKTPAFSKGAHLRAFSAESDGMLAGEGIGMLVLKRLEDAEKDNDNIYSVIRGIGSSSDGNFKSIYAPRSSGQANAIRRAYKQAGYQPSTVQLIEAHGTGTNAGDPAEFGGLREVFCEEKSSDQYIALGSVKSQIGHTKATAGAASMIKASLALNQKVLPATINVSKPNPAMEIESTPFYLNTETRPWFRDTSGNPRRAGVSSFGFGGTNFHIAMEEYVNEKNSDSRLRPIPYSILIDAETKDKLLQKSRDIVTSLEGSDKKAILDQFNNASNEASIPSDHPRIGFVALSSEDAIEKMNECIKILSNINGKEKLTHPKGIYYRGSGIDPKGKTVALFPGQGSQYLNMGRELAINFPSTRNAFEQTDLFITTKGKKPLTKTIFPIPVFSENDKKEQSEILTRTENAQPAIGTFSMALYNLLQTAGFQADFFAGHSFGELTALWASGVYDSEAFTRLAIARGEAMSTESASEVDTGTMIAVKGDVEKVQTIIKDQGKVSIANFNSPSQVVLAGSTKDVSAIKSKLEEQGLSVYPLKVSAAFHTDFVKHAQAPFSNAIKKEKFKAPSGIVYSNSTASKHDKDPQVIAKNLADHILNSVNFKEEIEAIFNDGGSIFIEIGPKKVLSNLVKDILKEKQHEIITLNPNPRGDSDLQFRQAVLQMRVLGFKLNDVDPYQNKHIEPKSNQSKVSVTLNGGLYMTKKTRKNYEDALQNKSNKMKSISPTISVGETGKKITSPKSTILSQPSDSSKQNSGTMSTINKDTDKNNKNISPLIETLQQHQDSFLKAHQLFLQNDGLSKKIIQEITSIELSLLSQLNGSPQSPAAERTLKLLEKRAEFVNNQHTATSETHLEYIKSQSTFSRQYTALIEQLSGKISTNQQSAFDQANIVSEATSDPSLTQVTKLPSVQPASLQKDIHTSQEATTKSTYDISQLTKDFLEIVSDKTGYPTDMLELSMDMEADLGIDSIKRVEILGAMQEQFPELPSIEAEELAVLRTLEQIIGAFSEGSKATAPAQLVSEAHDLSSSTNNVDSHTYQPNDLKDSFLAIVSDKTGYPTDMLELNMDMEADLGIDSIKRVEILGAMQEQFPNLPTIDAEELVVLRTLEQIINAFNTGATNSQPVQSKEQAAKPNSIDTTLDIASEQTTSSVSDLNAAFLEIVSDKTGYPPDMLELEMDMEADLGIDSIKRVEILGAMQEQYPELPSIEAEELAMLRTLEQIISAFSKKSNNSSKASLEEIPTTPEHGQTKEEPIKIERHLVRIKKLPIPDTLKFDIPKQNLILITDDGTERSQQIADYYVSQNLKVGMIHFDTAEKKKSNDGLLHLDFIDANDDEIKSKMDEIINSHEKISVFIHVNPPTNMDGKEMLAVSEKNSNILKSVFLIARHLKKPLTSEAEKSRSAFLTVSQIDGQFGLNGKSSNDPLPGGLPGLAKTLRLEWDNVFCRAIDLHPEIDAKTAAKMIDSELHDPDLHLAEVGYTVDGRYTITIE